MEWSHDQCTLLLALLTRLSGIRCTSTHPWLPRSSCCGLSISVCLAWKLHRQLLHLPCLFLFETTTATTATTLTHQVTLTFATTLWIIHSIALSDKLLQSFNVCRGHVHFNVIMSRTTCPEGYHLAGFRQGLEESLTVVEGYDGIVAAMDDIDGTPKYVEVWM